MWKAILEGDNMKKKCIFYRLNLYTYVDKASISIHSPAHT